MSFGDAVIPPRSPGPPRHVHTREDEGIYVIDGVLTRRARGADRGRPWRLPVEASGPAAHLRQPLSDLLRGLELINTRGFEQFFFEMAEYVASTDGAPDEEVIIEMNQRNGICPAGGGPVI